jgi:hypothetical protein
MPKKTKRVKKMTKKQKRVRLRKRKPRVIGIGNDGDIEQQEREVFQRLKNREDIDLILSLNNLSRMKVLVALSKDHDVDEEVFDTIFNFLDLNRGEEEYYKIQRYIERHKGESYIDFRRDEESQMIAVRLVNDLDMTTQKQLRDYLEFNYLFHINESAKPGGPLYTFIKRYMEENNLGENEAELTGGRKSKKKRGRRR